MTLNLPNIKKFKIDKLPNIIYYETWDYKCLIRPFKWHYGKIVKPVSVRRSERDIDDNCGCPRCNAQSLISTRIMVQRTDSVQCMLHRILSEENRFQSPTPSNARTAITRWLIRKTTNTLLSTNA